VSGERAVSSAGSLPEWARGKGDQVPGMGSGGVCVFSLGEAAEDMVGPRELG